MIVVDIKRLIPQRSPILMVDQVDDVREQTAQTSLAIRPDNYFIDEDGKLSEPGLIEHIAQSASAFAGYKALEAGASQPPIGYIGEIKKFHCSCRPSVGTVLHTTVTMGPEVAGVTILNGEVRVGDEIVASTQMKIFVKPE